MKNSVLGKFLVMAICKGNQLLNHERLIDCNFGTFTVFALLRFYHVHNVDGGSAKQEYQWVLSPKKSLVVDKIYLIRLPWAGHLLGMGEGGLSENAYMGNIYGWKSMRQTLP